MTLVAWANSENHLDKDNLVYLDSSAKAVACWGEVLWRAPGAGMA